MNLDNAESGFNNHELNLIIEVDGEIHDSRKEFDATRQEFLEACGYTVIRFANDEVDNQSDRFIEKGLHSKNRENVDYRRNVKKIVL